MASLASLLKVFEQKEHNSDDLFFAEEVKNLNYFLNNVEIVIFEVLDGEWMIRYDPQGGNHVIRDLCVCLAPVVQ